MTEKDGNVKGGAREFVNELIELIELIKLNEQRNARAH